MIAHTPLRLFVMAGLIGLSGCGSISKGVTEALLEQKTVDNRTCEITGGEFAGLRSSMDRDGKHITKLLMVHGVGHHEPGYSTRFQEKLARSLKLDVRSELVKDIALSDLKAAARDESFKQLGDLHISRYTNQDRSHEMLFYELTWSPITEPEKEYLAYDNADTQGFKRAEINGLLKSFMNSTVPDMLIYVGNRNEHINLAVSQSVCWMFSGGWDVLPDKPGTYSCNPGEGDKHTSIENDDFFFVTHSLGSRITIDTINRFSDMFESQPYRTELGRIVGALQQKEISVYMLANQLPLLQMGREKPAVTESLDQYCGPGAPKAANRLIGKTNIIAFNDPNDILSYPLPLRYAEEMVDSRICPNINNVSINVAHVRNILGAADFADPLTAHSDYQEDDRVVKLITDGLSRTHEDPMLKERCYWLETVKP